MAKAGIGLCVMHDVNHGGFSNNKTLNKFMTLLLHAFTGGHSLSWRIQHNQIHHNYTNIRERDEDIAPRVVFWGSNHILLKKQCIGFQFLYAWFFYGLMTIMWCTVKDFRQIIRFNKQKLLIGKTNLAKELVIITLSKIAYFWIYALTLFS